MLFAINETYCQESCRVTGIVLDEKNNPLPNASIYLKNKGDSSIIASLYCDVDGKFLINLPDSSFIIAVSYIGYKTFEGEMTRGDYKKVVLYPDTLQFPEIMVKGSRPALKLTNEGVLTYVEGTVLSKLGTANDVLKHMPSIIAKDGTYEVFGKGSPIIYIDSRPIRNEKELEQLKSTDIKSIELITNPDAKYDATVGAVVKILTVHKAGDGLSFDIWGQWQQGRKEKEATSFDLNYRHDGLDVFTSLWANKGKHLQIAELTQEVQTDTLWKQRNDMQTDIAERDYSIEVGFNYLLGEKHTFGAKYEYSFPTDYDETTTLTSDVTANSHFYDKWQNLTSKQTRGNASHKVNAYYIGKVGNLDIEWNFDYLHSGYDEQSKIEEMCKIQDSRLLNADNKVRNNMLASKLTITYPLLGGGFNFGVEYINTDRQDDYVNPQNYVASSYSTLKEQSICPYAEYSKTQPKVGILRAGLRYEHVKFDYYESGNLVEGQSRSYGNIYPSVSFSTHLGKVMVLLAYSSKTTRPTYRQLSNDVFYGNRYTLQRGNPLLENSTVHTISFQGTWKYLQFSLSYSDERDAIIHWMEQIENSAVTMVTFKNISSLKSFTPFVSIATTFGIWNPQFSLGIRKQWFKLETTQGIIHLNKPIIMIQANNTFTFSPSLTGELNFRYQGRGDYQNISQTYHQMVFNVSLAKTFYDGRLSLKLAGEDLLNRNRDGNFCYNHQVKLYQGNYYDRRRFVVSLRYTFNLTRSKYKGTGAGNDEKNRL